MYRNYDRTAESWKLDKRTWDIVKAGVWWKINQTKDLWWIINRIHAIEL